MRLRKESVGRSDWLVDAADVMSTFTSARTSVIDATTSVANAAVNVLHTKLDIDCKFLNFFINFEKLIVVSFWKFSSSTLSPLRSTPKTLLKQTTWLNTALCVPLNLGYMYNYKGVTAT